jgi:hypothetical protein
LPLSEFLGEVVKIDRYFQSKKAMENHIPSPLVYGISIFLETQLGGLRLFDFDGLRRTNFNTAFAPQALVHIDWLGLAIFDFKYAGRASIYAFALAVTLAFINGYGIHRLLFTSSG